MVRSVAPMKHMRVGVERRHMMAAVVLLVLAAVKTRA